MSTEQLLMLIFGLSAITVILEVLYQIHLRKRMSRMSPSELVRYLFDKAPKSQQQKICEWISTVEEEAYAEGYKGGIKAEIDE